MTACRIEDCQDPAVARQFCNTHYHRWKRHGDPLKTLKKPARDLSHKPPCSIDGCEKNAVNRGWCSTHYGRWQRHGDPQREPDYSRKPKEKGPAQLPNHLVGWLNERRARLGRNNAA